MGNLLLDKEYYFLNENLVVWVPTGELDYRKIVDFVNFLNEQSKKRDPHFNRFVDLTKVSNFSLSFNNLEPVSKTRKIFHDMYFKKEVRMGFYVNNDLSYGMARMYQSLVGPSLLNIFISQSLDELANFLQIDKKELCV